jgi:predicted NBD/HSP70 family sugar kinase
LIRQVNAARVFHALRENPGSSQRRLCTLTRLDASTVSSVVAGLEAARIVKRLGGRRSGHAGRPEGLLQVDRDGGILIGAAIEVDGVRLIATGLDGERRAALTMDPADTVELALAQLQRGVQTLLGQLGTDFSQVRGIGIGQTGLIDRTGHLVLAPRFGWRDVELGARVRALFPVPVRLENDTKAAALAEHLFGACRGVGDFVLMHGGSGVGGALYLQGALYHGIGLGGELGHMKVVPNGQSCSCGGRGCLEAYLSEVAIRNRLAMRGLVLPTPLFLDAPLDPAIQTLLDDAGATLGLAMANLVNLLHPQRIVLAGSLAALSQGLLPQARLALAANALPAMGGDVEIIISALGADAVELGGVALAMEGFFPVPARLDGIHRI